jgi:hypothetical protein
LIQQAELVIVDISRSNANVFYELGYAVAKRKQLVLIKQRNAKTHADVAGFEYFDYTVTRSGLPNKRFETALGTRLRDLLHSPVPLYREMLQGISPSPVYIAAHPKHSDPRRPATKIQYRDKKTFGDYLGVTGLLAASSRSKYNRLPHFYSIQRASSLTFLRACGLPDELIESQGSSELQSLAS